MPKKDIVVIGGSTGSGQVLKQLFRSLPEHLPASVFVTTHMPTAVPSYLAEVLNGAGGLPVTRALEGMPIEPGHAYIAGQDRHLLLTDGVIRMGAGPHENLARPAIDPMFRSAALAYGSRAVGVVLTGKLSDGAAGLDAIKRRGGTAIVQHPLDAEADDMPRAALESVAADHIGRAGDLAEILMKVVQEEAGVEPPASDELIFEVEVAAGAPLGSRALRNFAQPASLTCPDCGGVLSEVQGSRPLRYRCQIGHAYTGDILISHNAKVEEAIRIAMRLMEERVELVERMARDARESGRDTLVELYEKRAGQYRRYARTLREAALLTLRMNRRLDQQPA